ncbi:hypothetical protein [Actinacidiphila soli]|uniref:hypothetical protein n=1 Tax=Actinacidiphila soli TaxID=2487275 RepID=UPI000FCB2CA8|nr:hypothetical protein [Actinacidiphila soli]
MAKNTSEQPIIETASTFGGGWKMVVKHTHETGVTVTEVWAFGALLSVTTLTVDGVVTVDVPSAS